MTSVCSKFLITAQNIIVMRNCTRTEKDYVSYLATPTINMIIPIQVCYLRLRVNHPSL